SSVSRVITVSIPRPCLTCGRLIRGGSRCAVCEAAAYRGSVLTPSGSRSAWSRLRAWVLEQEPVCVVCRVRPSTAVHHRVRRVDGGTDQASNLIALCHECHRSMHGKQAEGRGVGLDRIE